MPILIPDRIYGALDREVPEYEPEPEFSEFEVEDFIADLACSDDPCLLLESWGVSQCLSHEAAGMFQEMAVIWKKDSSKVSAACGAWFWKCMKQCAMERFEHRVKSGYYLD